MRTKGTTPVISIAMLLMIVIILAAAAFSFFMKIESVAASGAEGQVENIFSMASKTIRIENINDRGSSAVLYIRNSGSSEIEADEIAVYLDGEGKNCSFAAPAIAPGSVGSCIINESIPLEGTIRVSSPSNSDTLKYRLPAPASAGYIAFSSLPDNISKGPNIVQNPSFESGGSGWSAYNSGFTVASGEGRNGSITMKMAKSSEELDLGASKVIQAADYLNQTKPKPIYFSAWSRAEGVTGEPDEHYAVYARIVYFVGGTETKTLIFSTGTHDWELAERYIMPDSPIWRIYLYIVFEKKHSGIAWFDDIEIKEVNYTGNIIGIDKAPAIFSGHYNHTTEREYSLATGDGLELGLRGEGGNIFSVKTDGREVANSSAEYASGFLIRDVKTGSGWHQVGGTLSGSGNTLFHSSRVRELALDFRANYTQSADRINISAEVEDISGEDRAISLYFALPVEMTGWEWGSYARVSEKIGGYYEKNSFVKTSVEGWNQYGEGVAGSNGYVSLYPFGSISSPEGDVLAIAYPLDKPCLARIVANPQTSQLYVVFDLGITSVTKKFPRKARVSIVLYKKNAGEYDNGFRAALQGYYDRFPGFFESRIQPESQGLWYAFKNVSHVLNLEDFGLGTHELSWQHLNEDPAELNFLESKGIVSFRYLIWLSAMAIRINNSEINGEMNVDEIDVYNYSQVSSYLNALHNNKPSYYSGMVEPIWSSCFWGQPGSNMCTYVPYNYSGPSWCKGKCIEVWTNPDPEINFSGMTSKAGYSWNADALDMYSEKPQVDGEFFDGIALWLLDFRENSVQNADYPLTFGMASKIPGQPMLFSSVKLMKKVKSEMPAGKLVMNNNWLVNNPFGADMSDYLGREVSVSDWINSSGGFQPLSDKEYSFYRAVSGKKPFALLHYYENSSALTPELVEGVLKTCLFYGIYPPLFFSTNGTGFFDDAAIYEPHRNTYKKYVPRIKEINAAGWEAMTNANTSDQNIYIERYGDYPAMYITLRNIGGASSTLMLSIDRDALGIPAGQLRMESMISSSIETIPAGASSIQLTLGSRDVELYKIS